MFGHTEILIVKFNVHISLLFIVPSYFTFEQIEKLGFQRIYVYAVLSCLVNCKISEKKINLAHT